MGRDATGSSRRTWLARALALGVSGLSQALAAEAVAKGVVRVRGEARVNGRLARPGMEIAPGEGIATGRDAELLFVVGRDAFLARGDTRLELSGERIVQALRLVTGALLSVYPPVRGKRSAPRPP